ncbi:MAG TPA: hypothetical protein VKU82_06855 [Planctomycetaceae bacterium]|nr:hypothetical protein [Planctomycetaceae bacterium]
MRKITFGLTAGCLAAAVGVATLPKQALADDVRVPIKPAVYQTDDSSASGAQFQTVRWGGGGWRGGYGGWRGGGYRGYGWGGGYRGYGWGGGYRGWGGYYRPYYGGYGGFYRPYYGGSYGYGYGYPAYSYGYGYPGYGYGVGIW